MAHNKRKAAARPTARRRVEAGPKASAATVYDAFAVAAPGLAPLVAQECRRLPGIGALEVSPAGVEFRGDARTLFAANLQLRVASRVLVRAAHFEAAHFSDLVREARRVPWSRFVAPGSRVAIRATSRKSRLYHTGAIADRLIEAIQHTVSDVGSASHDEEVDSGTDVQLIVVRLDRDQCTISIDSSGDLLHRRGYRQAVARAPLRETLASALLAAAEWSASEPLVDPCCGSGTIPIEAALAARNIPPGLNRSFSLQRWPEFLPKVATELRTAAQEQILPAAPAPIVGSDRDAGAIEAAQANATRAGVSNDIEFVVRPISAVVPPSALPGLIAANPPYGERVGEAEALRDFYSVFGKLSRNAMKGWRVALLASDRSLVGNTGLRLAPVVETSNGGIPVAVYR